MANRIRKTMLTFYVTDEEKEFIKHKMSLMNITNMSAYLRKMAIDGRLIQVDYSQFDNISEQLSGVSRNINQIAKRINATDTVYAGDMRDIKQKQEEIWQLLNSIESQLL
ncbi:MAG: plasmid mobilization relaxosome protein MobC [Ruminococcus sp.]|nr:plasmid mobilization relaxosome protein MobC [Ruminococcus sp.]